ncbi:MAG: TolC family protein [Bryobacteraceae bacterium]|nr:TolC family protein [Bryobacteraceae bacterium]
MKRDLALLIILGTSPADAQSLKSLIQEALENSPDVAAARNRVEAARQRPSQVSSLPDPMVSPGWQSVGYPWPGAGLGAQPMANIGLMVTQEVPFPGKRRLAGDMAEREAGAEWHDYQQVQLGLVSKIKQAYYRRAYAAGALEVLERSTALLKKFQTLTELRYSVGKAAQQDVLKTQTQLTILEARRVQLERETAAREAKLLSLANRQPGGRLEPAQPLQRVEIRTTLEELFAAAKENSPMLRRDEKMIQRAELALNMARKEYYPDFAVNAGVYSMGAMAPMYMFRADFRLPLYYFRKQRAGVAEKAHELAGQRKSYEAGAQSLVYRIKDDFLMAQASAQLAGLYEKEVIPLAGLTLESSLAGYESGQTQFLDVMMNLITVVEYGMNYLEEMQNVYVALARLEEMTGKELLP